MTLQLVLLIVLFSDLNVSQYEIQDYFVQGLHGAVQNQKTVGVLNFSQMKTKFCVVDIEKQVVTEVDDPRLKIFGSRNVLSYGDGFMIINHKKGFVVSGDFEFSRPVSLDSVAGWPMDLLLIATQQIHPGVFFCRFANKKRNYSLGVLDLGKNAYQELYAFRQSDGFHVAVYQNQDNYYFLNNDTAALEAYDASFKLQQQLLPTRDPLMRKKTSRLYRRHPYRTQLNTVFADATTIWFYISEPDESGTGRRQKHYKLQDGKLHAVTDSRVILARVEGKQLAFDTEEGLFEIVSEAQ